MPLALAADKLSLERGGRIVVRDLSFWVKSGETLVLVGPNGSGKTTLIRALAGFLKPAAGRIVLEGGDPERELGEHCHYVGHANAVKANLSVAENLVFWARFLGGSVTRVPAALEALALAELAHVPAGMLSAGQRRRVCLARLMVAQRPVWLLDEPTVSLDASSVALLTRAMTAHCAGGGIVLAATHLPLGLDKARELRLGDALEAA